MGFVQQLLRSNFFIKLRSWEYWPFGIVQFPTFFYFGWLALRTRSITFFSASNPGIVMGGMFGESKYDILEKIPAELKPQTILITAPTNKSVVINAILQSGMTFPVIFKPELGERGFQVTRINSELEIDAFLSKMSFNFLVQEFVTLPMEFGVFYSRNPKNRTGEVTSIVMKEMLSVTGNGRDSLRQLILNKDRAKLQWSVLRIKFQSQLDEVVPAGETIELISIGNHCLGTKFINRNDLINERLNASFDQISKQIEGFYFGRYDLRCGDIQDLFEGKVKIMELNGCGAEPAHIYDPDFPFAKAVVTLLKHWRTIFEIARENNHRGIPYIRLKDALMYYKIFKQRVT